MAIKTLKTLKIMNLFFIANLLISGCASFKSNNSTSNRDECIIYSLSIPLLKKALFRNNNSNPSEQNITVDNKLKKFSSFGTRTNSGTISTIDSLIGCDLTKRPDITLIDENREYSFTLKFSKINFTENGNKAEFNIGYLAAPLYGGEHIFYGIKQDGKWTVEKSNISVAY